MRRSLPVRDHDDLVRQGVERTDAETIGDGSRRLRHGADQAAQVGPAPVLVTARESRRSKPITRPSPRVGCSPEASSRGSVVFPAPFSPSSVIPSPAEHVQGHAAQDDLAGPASATGHAIAGRAAHLNPQPCGRHLVEERGQPGELSGQHQHAHHHQDGAAHPLKDAGVAVQAAQVQPVPQQRGQQERHGQSQRVRGQQRHARAQAGAAGRQPQDAAQRRAQAGAPAEGEGRAQRHRAVSPRRRPGRGCRASGWAGGPRPASPDQRR